MALARRQTIWAFLALAATVYVAVFFLSRSAAAAANPGRIGIGAMCDLIVTVPVLYYRLLVRYGYSSGTAVIAVALTGARAAGFLLPAAEQTWLPSLRWLGVPLELFVIISVVRRLRRLDSSIDAATRIRQAASALVRNERIADMVAAEIEVFYYALFSWRAKPQARSGCQAFSCGEASGFVMFSTLVGAVIVFEGIPMHFLLQHWNHTAAYIYTAFDVYAMLWAVALHRSLHLRPVLIGEQSILLQAGLVWRIEVTHHNLKTMNHLAGQAPGRREPGYLSMVAMNDPQWLIELKEPVTARGPYGVRRTVTKIGIAVDNSESFRTALGF
jgi:hypothetical protein